MLFKITAQGLEAASLLLGQCLFKAVCVIDDRKIAVTSLLWRRNMLPHRLGPP